MVNSPAIHCRVDRTRKSSSGGTTETSFYLSSLRGSILLFAFPSHSWPGYYLCIPFGAWILPFTFFLLSCLTTRIRFYMRAPGKRPHFIVKEQSYGKNRDF